MPVADVEGSASLSKQRSAVVHGNEPKLALIAATHSIGEYVAKKLPNLFIQPPAIVTPSRLHSLRGFDGDVAAYFLGITDPIFWYDWLSLKSRFNEVIYITEDRNGGFKCTKES